MRIAWFDAQDLERKFIEKSDIEFEELLRKSDIVTLHCPLTEQTRHLLSDDEFEKMDGALLINTARGGLVDTDALLRALKNDNVVEAGLDVLEEEQSINDDIEVLAKQDGEKSIRTLLGEHMLMNRDDVLITPHNAFNSVEVPEKIVEVTLVNLEECENIATG